MSFRPRRLSPCPVCSPDSSRFEWLRWCIWNCHRFKLRRFFFWWLKSNRPQNDQSTRASWDKHCLCQWFLSAVNVQIAEIGEWGTRRPRNLEISSLATLPDYTQSHYFVTIYASAVGGFTNECDCFGCCFSSWNAVESGIFWKKMNLRREYTGKWAEQANIFQNSLRMDKRDIVFLERTQ